MNGLFLILSLIVLGYIYYNKEVTKYSINEMPSHQLYYKFAIAGFYFFCAGLLVTFFILYGCSLVDYVAHDDLIKNIEKLPDFKLIWIVSFFISLLICGLVCTGSNKILLRGLNRNDHINEIYAATLSSPIDKMLNDSAFLNDQEYKNKLVMLSMNDKKVYIGTVFPDRKIFERFFDGQSEFLFCPIYSGYRNKDTLKVTITTSYFDNQELGSFKKYQIVLNRKNIVTATKVDLETLMDFTDTDDFLNKLVFAYSENLPVLVVMKNRNIYIGKISDNLSHYSLSGEINNFGIKLSYNCLFEKDKLDILKYYDFSKVDDLYCNLNFKEIESVWLRLEPENIWRKNEVLSPELMLKMFDYKLIQNTN